MIITHSQQQQQFWYLYVMYSTWVVCMVQVQNTKTIVSI